MITEKDIQNVFRALLDQIKDQKLADLTIKTWAKGCELGQWPSMDALQKMPFTLLTDARGINLIEHTIAVTEGAAGLARAMQSACKRLPFSIDMDRLIAGGILHDVGKLMEIEPDGQGGYQKSLAGKMARHPISGAVLGGQMGLPDDIINIIACHAKEGEGRPQVPETILIHQADFACFNPLVMLKADNLIL